MYFCDILGRYKNKGVQVLLDAISSYLPSPFEKANEALDTSANEAKVVTSCASKAPLIALAFKLEQGPFGQLTYVMHLLILQVDAVFYTSWLSGTCACTKARSSEAIL